MEPESFKNTNPETPISSISQLPDLESSTSKLTQEVEEGNIEYKRQLINLPPERLEKLTTQLKWRLYEGNGEMMYEIGVEDDGTPTGISSSDLEESIDNVRKMASKLNCEVSVVCRRNGIKGKVAELLVREVKEESFSDLRVAVCGNVDSGKSTLVGVLTSSMKDNGRGSARVTCFNHSHEITTGRTSSIGHKILGFNARGECVNDIIHSQIEHRMSSGDIIEQSYKVISFLDLAGHEKYLKTTVSGLSGHLPDYAFLVIGANMGITKMTKEHLKLILSFKITLVVVITKIDMCPQHILEKTQNDIVTLIKGANKKSIFVKTNDDLIVTIKNIQSDQLVPIFNVSSVTLENMDLLKMFLNMVPHRIQWDLLKDKPGEVVISDIYTITGVGTVVVGVVTAGSIRNGEEMLLGPMDNGEFIPVKIRSLQVNRVPVKQVSAGKSAGFALKTVKKSQIRKGMLLTSKENHPKASWCFEAQIVVLHHSTSIRKNYQPVVQSLTVRQSAKLVNIANREFLKTGDKSTVRFQFMHRPEYIQAGMRMILREGSCKAIGVISKVIGEREITVRLTKKIVSRRNVLKLEEREQDVVKKKSLKVSC